MVTAVDTSSDRPVYKQIAEPAARRHLKQRVSVQVTACPASRNSSMRTAWRGARLRQAINLRNGEDMIEVEHGRGSFVRSRGPVRRLAHDRFSRRRSRSRAAGDLSLTHQALRPPAAVAAAGVFGDGALRSDRTAGRNRLPAAERSPEFVDLFVGRPYRRRRRT
jgi:GntR family transcriptional regulator